MSDRLLEFAPGLWAHCSAALWMPEDGVAIVADVHLGYAWAQRRRGQLGPLADGQVGTKLREMVEELKPEEVISLGDLVHAPRPSREERDVVVMALREITTRTRLRVVRGNHDRALERDFPELGITMVDSWEGSLVKAFHGDRLSHLRINREKRHVLGHWHPTVSICDAAGAVQRLPAFLVTDHFCMMPAFSPFAAGFDVGRGLPSELESVAGDGESKAIAVTGKRAMFLGRLTPRARKRRMPGHSGEYVPGATSSGS